MNHRIKQIRKKGHEIQRVYSDRIKEIENHFEEYKQHNNIDNYFKQAVSKESGQKVL